MRKVKEIDIEKEYVRIAQEQYGILSEKFIIQGRKGKADRINFLPGNHVFFIEFKLDYNEMSPHQEKVAKMYKRLGYNTYECYTVKDALNALKVELHASRTKTSQSS